ncbi:MAG TPA: FAD-dependent oxidoreductase [Mycobacteriales bacterium]|nr:FAD-dependent oxidoreductase [Mycobacteriales bacterium]
MNGPPNETDPGEPPDGRAWDLLVVGGGTAGILAARTAAGFGASVLLVERDRTGGECLWTGCVPSKALLAAAAAAADARNAYRLGITVAGVTVDFGAVLAHVRAAVAAIEPGDSPRALAEAGIRVARASARFTGPATAAVAGRVVRFRQAVIATGSEPVLPPIPGLAEAAPLTSDTVWSLTELPRRLAVLGGGSVGCELGQAFARLGSRVSIIEAAPRLLTGEDPDASGAVTDGLRADGVTVLTNAAATAVHADRTLVLGDGTRLGFDTLLVAVGRRPRTDDLGLGEAGVAFDEGGHVRVDPLLRTSNRRIWAAGDVTGHPQFTHTAGVHGSLAAGNAILGLRRRVRLAAMPRVTFTQPEVAAVGLGDEMARHHGLAARTVCHAHVDRAVTDGHTGGFSRLVIDGRGRVLGATVVGPRAGDTLAELVLAVGRGLRTRDLAAATHPYPTYGYGPWDAAIADVGGRLRRPVPMRAITVLAAARRRWMDRRAHPG